MLVAFSIVTSMLAACGGKNSFLIVQICLGDPQNLAAFTREMQVIARSENMRFIDGSEETRDNLAAMNKEAGLPERAGPVIHMAVRARDSLGVTAANWGWPGYQVALGFSEGFRPRKARLFAERVVSRLEEHWRVERVPAGMGAQPMRNCNTNSGPAMSR
jgi:hypothetical protein